MDETLAQALLDDLRATRARLEAALEDAASLKVLLALRTHQHDLAWQAGQRLEAELAAARGRAAEQAATLSDTAAAGAAATEALSQMRAESAAAEERTEAVRTVLRAVLDSIGRRALDRRRFRDLIARAGRETPDEGPGAARHAVLLAEARCVLGIEG